MNLEQLASFIEVARTGHFTHAAAELHLAQPSLSRQISTLEKELGSPLFHRARGHIGLTAAGEILLPTAKRMLADAESISRDMAELAGLRTGRVRLGATPTLSVSLVAEAIARFRNAHPGVGLELMEKGSRQLITALGSGELDFALITRTSALDSSAPRLRTHSLLREDLVVISAAGSRAATGSGLQPGQDTAGHPTLDETITIAEVAELPQIAFHHGYDLREATSAAFEAAGLRPRFAVEGAEMDAVLRLVERGIGIAIVPATVLVDRPTLRSTRLVEPTLSRTVSLAARADVTTTRAASALEKTIRTVAAELAAEGSPLAAHLRPAG